MRERVVVIRPDARVECIYDDRLNLTALGSPVIRRVSEVEHDGEVWVARTSGTEEVIASGPTRGGCIEREIDFFQAQLVAGERPFDQLVPPPHP